MGSERIIISGTGCALGDFLYNGVSFEHEGFLKFKSVKPGDGGLSPGKLVFTEELEKFSGCSYVEILKEIIGERQPDAFNVGGPSLVSLIHASQILNPLEYEVKYFGMAGEDDTARKITDIVRKTPLNIKNYETITSKGSPFTDVFSDPSYDNGNGERTFVNNIGAAWEYSAQYLTDDFFNSHIVCFGGTALVPQIHNNLTSLLARAKSNDCITVLNTVFDFMNEKTYPGKPWPPGNNPDSFRMIDILIMDMEESLKISGQMTIEKAAEFFASTELSSFIITNGANNMYFWSGGGLFKEKNITQLPVSKKITGLLKSASVPKGDTTGCGDNFAGGIIASLAWQLKTGTKGEFDLTDAISWGTASGGFTCFTVGGTYLEKDQGEKLIKIRELREDYLAQISGQNLAPD